MSIGLHEYKTKHKEVICNAIADLVGRREPDWQGRFFTDNIGALKMSIFAHTLFSIGEIYPQIELPVDKLKHVSDWWATEIAEYRQTNHSDSTASITEHLKRFVRDDREALTGFSSLLTWIKGGIDSENSNRNLDTIIRGIEDLSLIVAYTLGLDNSEQTASAQIIKTVLRGTENDSTHKNQESMELLRYGIRDHKEIIIEISTAISGELQDIFSAEEEEAYAKIIGNRGTLPIMLLFMFAIANITTLGKCTLNQETVSLFKKWTIDFGANRLSILGMDIDQMISPICQQFKGLAGTECNEEVLYGHAINMLIKSEGVRSLLMGTRQLDFIAAQIYISRCFCATLQVDNKTADLIADTVEAGINNSIEAYAIIGYDDEEVNAGVSDTSIALRSPINQGKEQSVSAEATKEKHSQETISLDESLQHLESLIGLGTIKNEVSDLSTVLKVMKDRRDAGLKVPEFTRHMVFTGNPGTGKTTVARILANIYRELGFLSKGHFIEVDRSNLVGGYLGQTAIKTKRVLENALGGILFIDEAYSLSPEGGNDPFGGEAIETIIKYMEDNRDDLIIIVAGYPDEMRQFLDSNPGMKSRFSRQLSFPDYSTDELSSIFLKFMQDSEYKPVDDLVDHLRAVFSEMIYRKDKRFGNARSARTLFENSIINHSKRISKYLDPGQEDMVMLAKEDVLFDDIYTALGRAYI
jgi:AAA+ superfamily predicted ATPase